MFTVIYKTGTVQVFRVREVAELYAFLNQGTLITEAVFQQPEVVSV